MTQEEADKLILGHMRLVIKIAGQYFRRFPPRTIPFSDLVGWGNIGLVRAAHRFQADKGLTFLTYSQHIIRGAILDGLRIWFGDERVDGRSSAHCFFTELYPHNSEQEESEPRFQKIDTRFAELEAMYDIAKLTKMTKRSSRKAVAIAKLRMNEVPIAQIARKHSVCDRRISQLAGEGIAAMRAAAGL